MMSPCHCRFITTLWCGQVVFDNNNDKKKNGNDNDNNETTTTTSGMIRKKIPQGSIDVDETSGTIVACWPGESWDQAQERNCLQQQRHDNSDNTTTTLWNLGKDMVLSPGWIDVHTHISELGRNWEGYETATLAAAAGGITTIMGMPLNSLPPTTTMDAVELEYQTATYSNLYVDIGLWGGVVPNSINPYNVKSLLNCPFIFGLKVFLAPLPATAGYQAISPKQLFEVAKLCQPTGKPILVHSELMTEEQVQVAMEESFSKHDNDLDDDNNSQRRLSSYAAHLASRPAKWEQDAVRVVCQAVAEENCRMHIVHLSDATGCLPIIEASSSSSLCQKSHNQLLTVETCPHYLWLDEDSIPDGDTRVKCFPPIRDWKNRQRLWKGLDNGLIDMIASDHSPCEPSMRHMDTGNFKTAWGGLSGLQYQLQATWTEAHDRGYTPLEMVRWWSCNPAKLIGLSSSKGSIAPGMQADLCWWDPNHVGATNEYCQEYHRWKGTTIYADDQRMRGRVLGTWVRGNLVYDGLNDKHLEPKGQLLSCL